MGLDLIKKSTHSTQKKQEKRVASSIGGKRKVASGSRYWAKGDAVSDELLVDAKQTEKKSISITTKMIEKVNDEAIANDKVPAISVEFLNIGRLAEKDWILVPMWHYEEVIDR